MKLVKMMKQVKIIKMLIMRWRSASGSLENFVSLWLTRSLSGYPELGSALDYPGTLVSICTDNIK